MDTKDLYQTIFKRKSVRKYKEEALSSAQLDNIKNFLNEADPLAPEIKYEYKIVNSDQVKSLIPIKAPHYLQFFSEVKDNHLLNAGFILEQLDLYLSANDLGSCWFGMAKPKKEIIADSELEYLITLVFGQPAEKLHRDSNFDFDRKSLSEIREGESYDDLLEAARFAPSATNGQPWYFKTEEGKIHVFQNDLNFIKKFFYKKMNGIDMGIVLAHLWLAAENKGYKFTFRRMPSSPEAVSGYNYLGTVELE